jgi:tetratricopeptide (TPR) repeat protein
MAITGILRNIADLAYEQHDFNRARDLYQQTLDLARAEHHTHDMAYAIRGLGHVARQIGDSQYAAALYYESLRMFRSIDDHRCIPFCLEALACIASAHDAERAARLLGAAQELRDQIGVTIPPAERGDHNAALAEVRSTLGIARFRNAWNEGQAMTLDEAVAYAFEQAAATIS